MIRFAIRLLVLLVVSAGVGLGYARYRGLPWKPDEQKEAAEKSAHERWVEQTAISLAEFKQHYEMGGLVIDARPRELFEQGHLDAPLIMNIPSDEADYHIERVLPFLGQTIVLYCSSDLCDEAETLYRVLERNGFYDMRVYHPGWEGILAAKLPTTTGPDMFTESVHDFGTNPETEPVDPNEDADPNTLDADGG